MIMLEDNMNVHEQTYRNEKDKTLSEEFIPLSALVLKIRMAAGDTIEKDISCASKYMLAAINMVYVCLIGGSVCCPITERP